MLKSTLALKKSDDLFEKSSMSFGDHLEELRQALIKASIWLMGGLCVGVPMATSVVAYMQRPLEAALDQFYREQSIREMESATKGTVDPNLKAWMEANQKRSEVIFVDKNRLSSLLKSAPVPPATNSPEDIPKDTQENAPVDASGKASDTGTEPKASPLQSEPAKNLSLADRFPLASADTEGLPTPDRLVPLRIFSSIKSQAETFNMQEGMMIWFKAALVVAAIVASPGIFYHVWGFVAAGLYPHERRYVYYFLPASLSLFWTGALFAFFVVFQLVISFLLNFNAMMGVGTSPRLNDYMSFALLLPLGFGISFQLPLVMLVVERLGIMSVKTYLQQWRMAIFIIAVVAMVLTPADVTSMIAMALPLIFLYFLGIALCHYVPRGGMLNGTAVDPR
ncbi:Sec-independent protein translocase protein TatCy [Pirellula sp. SH-Sr6A]|uniref:twin-arginine translocase subunit TatC n=1 Tax=Pirellula sp. SH-Sr6A TaxID=1632865 RepID=UPI00078ECB27|nr:twin-arginine translocase subunit TatC [Pirellula sp. SH-Sr6A]AMV32275.1 Sec-independent protein translocase protein TatCy [Pirellula sp. SH-Sr6A]